MSGARPYWPQNVELFAQADECLEAIRASHARIDRSLAEIFIANAGQPFPDLTPFGQGCSCVFGPRCESNRNCEDSAATMGVKDPRTGVISARARVSFFHPASPGPTPRLLFYCADCFAALRDAWGKPIPGITRPAHASEFWQPSLMEHIRLSQMEVNRQEAAKRPAPVYAPDDKPRTRRERGKSPEQWAQVLHVRKIMREGHA